VLIPEWMVELGDRSFSISKGVIVVGDVVCGRDGVKLSNVSGDGGSGSTTVKPSTFVVES
jgi:hypothetical protein